MPGDMMDMFFKHLSDIGHDKNKRIYIGPGRDGSSDDKIPVDLKFDPQNTFVSYSQFMVRPEVRQVDMGILRR